MNLSPAAARRAVLAAATLLALANPAPAQSGIVTKSEPNYTRAEDVVYGRRDGLALTMDVFAPKESNGAGVVLFVSAGYRSDRNLLALLHPAATTPFLERGYTVFAVMHGSQPKYTVPEIVEDAHRAVRFVRHQAKKYGVDPERIGAVGGSAGGHLSLMVGCAGRPGDPNAGDPVDRQSSKVAAVACFFPPTDFLALAGSCSKEVAAPFDFREMDPATQRLVAVTPERRREIGREASALTHASKGAAPTLIIHGDRDKVVPLAQSAALIARLKDCGVACELKVRAGRGHFGPWVAGDVPVLADWLDTHLLCGR